ncbi:hypothetical protein DRO33_00650 [Candidatus Bathyarchaeota archaeon]|nr:MAG: hypothetical protein DRO33_00650 [Candidatus Bathyarchaeota archaeon]
MLDPLLILVLSLLTCSLLAYVAALAFVLVALTGVVGEEHLREFLLSPLARLGPYLLFFLALIGLVGAVFKDLGFLAQMLVAFSLVILPSLVVAFPVSSCFLLACLAARYGRRTWPAFVVFLPPAALSLYLAFTASSFISAYLLEGYTPFFLVSSVVFSVGGCVRAPSA